MDKERLCDISKRVDERSDNSRLEKKYLLKDSYLSYLSMA